MAMFAALVGLWFGTPMIDDRVDTRLVNAIGIAILVTGYAVGMLLLRRILDPGPLARGDARWRYRSRALRERLARTRSWLVLSDRTSDWWATRSEFAAAVLAVIAAALAIVRSWGDGRAPVSAGLLAMAGAFGMFVGLAWMVRIYRAPLRLDSKAYWRYRDGA